MIRLNAASPIKQRGWNLYVFGLMWRMWRMRCISRLRRVKLRILTESENTGRIVTLRSDDVVTADVGTARFIRLDGADGCVWPIRERIERHRNVGIDPLALIRRVVFHITCTSWNGCQFIQTLPHFLIRTVLLLLPFLDHPAGRCGPITGAPLRTFNNEFLFIKPSRVWNLTHL